MNLIEVWKMSGDKFQRPTARQWTYKPFKDRFIFTIKIADWDTAEGENSQRQCPLKQFEVVKLYTTGRAIWYGVVTNIRLTRFRSWRSDYCVSVKSFDNILDAIEYSEKRHAKHKTSKTT